MSQKVSLKTLTLFRKRLWPYVRKYPALFAVSVLMVLITTFCALLTPWLLGYAVDHALVPKELKLLVPFALLYFATDALRALTMIVQGLTMTSLGQRVLHDLRQDLLKQYEFYPLSEFNQTRTGRLVTRLVNDTSSLQDLFTGGVAVALGHAIIVAGIVIWLVVLNPSLGLVCVSVFPFMVFAARYFGRKLRETFLKSRGALSKLNGFLAENISGMSIIQLFNKQAHFRKRFEQVSNHYTSMIMRTIETYAYFQPTITVLSSLSMSLLIWYGGYRVLDQTVTLGLLVTFMSYLQALFAPIRDITEKYNLFVSAMASSERIFEFMDRPQEKGTETANRAFSKPSFRGEIEFRNVWFRYRNEWNLKDVSFKVESGERVGIVGHTGAGKSTISALLMRFYDIQQGKLLLDRQDLCSFDKRAVRGAIGYIQQEPFLFSGTIRDNILLWEADRQKGIDALPRSIKECFESEYLSLGKQVLEKGSNLSSGERQIVAFLRALAQDPKILILDEATAHVDAITEGWISRVSNEAFQNRTVLVIAHRLATLKSVDRILVLHRGELVESGSHKELLSKGQIYRKLYDIQSRREELLGLQQENPLPCQPGY
ncbi:MAG: ABC transporter ATP-binding protein [Bdellovibrionota bacterium]